MGIKGLMTYLGMNGFAVAGLVISFCAFLAVLIWVSTRPREEMRAQSRICMDEDDDD